MALNSRAGARVIASVRLSLTGPSFVDMNFAPERIVKILRRQGDALKAFAHRKKCLDRLFRLNDHVR